jgi:hypothetical protein
MQKPVRSTEDKEEERKEFDGLFVNLSEDDSDTELLDFVPKKKVCIFCFLEISIFHVNIF